MGVPPFVETPLYTLWLFNIAMENGPFIDDFPGKTSIHNGFSIAMLNNQMVNPITDTADKGSARRRTGRAPLFPRRPPSVPSRSRAPCLGSCGWGQSFKLWMPKFGILEDVLYIHTLYMYIEYVFKYYLIIIYIYVVSHTYHTFKVQANGSRSKNDETLWNQWSCRFQTIKYRV